MTQLRCRKAEERARATTIHTGCPCKFVGYVGQDVGNHLQKDTGLLYEWCLVKKTNGEAYTVRVSYNHSIHTGQNIPHSPIRLRGHPGLVYSIQWFGQLAENITPGLQFCGLVYEGQSVNLNKALPSGGVDVLDAPVYWLFPTVETTCCTARHAQQYRHRAQWPNQSTTRTTERLDWKNVAYPKFA